MPSKSIMQSIAEVQHTVAVPKSKYNSFGGFSYRSFEDIVAALKEPCKKENIAILLEDDVVQLGERYYIRSTVRIFATDDRCGEITVSAFAREALDKKGSDVPQVSGMASSYARKYALCGAFAIDGGADPDTFEVKQTKEVKQLPQTGPFTARCKSCGTRYTFADATQYQQYIATAQCCPSPLWEIE